jgi:hypothetical protein
MSLISQAKYPHWRVIDRQHNVGGRRLKLDLLRHGQSVVHLNPKISTVLSNFV